MLDRGARGGSSKGEVTQGAASQISKSALARRRASPKQQRKAAVRQPVPASSASAATQASPQSTTPSQVAELSAASQGPPKRRIVPLRRVRSLPENGSAPAGDLPASRDGSRLKRRIERLWNYLSPIPSPRLRPKTRPAVDCYDYDSDSEENLAHHSVEHAQAARSKRLESLLRFNQSFSGFALPRRKTLEGTAAGLPYPFHAAPDEGGRPPAAHNPKLKDTKTIPATTAAARSTTSVAHSQSHSRSRSAPNTITDFPFHYVPGIEMEYQGLFSNEDASLFTDQAALKSPVLAPGPKTNMFDDLPPVRLVDRDSQTKPVLTTTLAHALRPYMPHHVQLQRDWRLLYSLDQHGISLNTMYSRVSDCLRREIIATRGCVLVVRDTESAVFGVYGSEPLKAGSAFYGNGESFLWKLSEKGGDDATEMRSPPALNLNAESPLSSPGGPSADGKVTAVQVFNWTGENEYFMLTETHSLAFGSGRGQFGLYIDQDLDLGSSRPCETFGNPILASGAEFQVLDLELWGFVDG